MAAGKASYKIIMLRDRASNNVDVGVSRQQETWEDFS